MSTITVPVNDRSDMSFDGYEVAHVSTRTEGRPRWTELALYKRDDGGWVLQRIGRSNTYHRIDCRKVVGRLDMEPVTVDDVVPEDYPCEECRPDKSSDATVVFERDKYSAVSVDSSKKLLRAMQDRDRNTHELRISTLSQELLRVASTQDQELQETIRQALLSRDI